MLSYLLSLLIPAVLVILFRRLNTPNKPAIFGVYQQKNKNYFYKYMFMYVVLRFRQLIHHIRRLYAVEVGKSDDGTVHVHAIDATLEQKFYLADYPQAIDAVYFNSASREGEAIICGLARRPRNIVDSFLYVKLKDEDLLLSPCLPDTWQEQSITEEGEYKIKGLELVNFIPMRTWKLIYKGDMKPKNNPGKLVKVEMDLTWSASFPPFNYDTQMAPKSMARDMAREKWSREYFKLLKKAHQTHYEQMGYIKGTVTVDGKEQTINMPCVRDHSFGKFRDWRTFHRYIYHFIFLENGDSMAIGTVCQPSILSHLTIGYLCRQSDQTVLPVQSCDLLMYQHGENQILPRDYGFVFKAGNQTYNVQILVNDEDSFFIGRTREAKLYERWCTVEVNDVKGWACVEWQYNNVQKDKRSLQM